jgi:non-lysosomal glucosylceramidase
VVFALAWDVPIVRFGSGSAYYRRYTRFYGTQGDSATDIPLPLSLLPPCLVFFKYQLLLSIYIVTDALHAYPMWEKMISDWQAPILADPGLPDFYKHALFNELYCIKFNFNTALSLFELI